MAYHKIHIKYKGEVVCGTADASYFTTVAHKVTCEKCSAMMAKGWNVMAEELAARHSMKNPPALPEGDSACHAVYSDHPSAAALGCMTLREVHEELQKILTNFPHLADSPLWVDAGPPQFKPASRVTIRPGDRGREREGMRAFVKTLQ